MSGFDFSNLTPDQVRLLERGGWTMDFPHTESKPTRKDAVGLIERGLLIAVSVRRRDSYGSYTMTEYRVPKTAQRAWALQKGVPQ
ncbi:MAG: hypothetical protein ACREPD_02070 [Stenotrophomonas sp.]|uniref:hypothetical protein n=1 Tax=Stenotrophomonas sp. TaxID=69392 RepID=UPI003D6CB5E7